MPEKDPSCGLQGSLDDDNDDDYDNCIRKTEEMRGGRRGKPMKGKAHTTKHVHKHNNNKDI